MQSWMLGLMLRGRAVPVATMALAFAAACDRGHEDASVDALNFKQMVAAQDAGADPCVSVPRADVEQVLGPLASPPVRAFSAERPDPDDRGKACLYRLADTMVGEVAVQVHLKDATVFESGAGMAMDAVARDAGLDAAKARAEADSAREATGWDYEGGIPFRGYVGRLGHVAVEVGYRSMAADPDRIARLAALVRDRLPDQPIAAPGADPNAKGSGDDPCGLLTRQAVEAVLGALAVAPYRSRKETALADGRGESCSYYRGKHRVVVLTPTWNDGRELFRMSAGFDQRITSALGVGGQAADTLDGAWDQAGSGIAGELYFLKGDRMLALDYRTGAVDAAAAVRLAAAAIKRL